MSEYRDPNRINYDPNYNGSLHAKKTVRVTLGSWDYRKTFDVKIGGNTMGLSVIEAAAHFIFYDLVEHIGPDEIGRVILSRPAEDGGDEEDTLIIDDDSERGEDWIADMVIAAEVIGIEEEDDDA